MAFSEQLLLTLIGVIVGFGLSQSINVVRYFRRPKLRVSNFSNGVLSCYTGDPPETPSTVNFGFHLENNGWNPALNTRVFISDLHSANRSSDPFDEVIIELTELAKPIDIIPPGEVVTVNLGQLASDKQYLEIHSETKISEDQRFYIEADTRGKQLFRAKILVTCDDLDSFQSFELTFHPSMEDISAEILEDFPLYLDIKNNRFDC